MVKKIDLSNEADENKMNFGGLGIRVLTPGPAVLSEHFSVLQAKVDSVISCKSNKEAGDKILTSYEMPARWYIVGDFSNVNVISGELVGYLSTAE